MQLFNILLFLSLLTSLLAGSANVGPVGNIIINSIYECPENERPASDDLVIKLELKTDDQGIKSLSAFVKNKIAIDDNLQISIDIKKLEDGEWVKFYNFRGKPCQNVYKQIQELWEKLVNAASPVPEGLCPIKPGSYTIEEFQASSSDVKLAAIVYGKLKVKLNATNKKGEVVYCVMGEGDSEPK